MAKKATTKKTGKAVGQCDDVAVRPWLTTYCSPKVGDILKAVLCARCAYKAEQALQKGFADAVARTEAKIELARKVLAMKTKTGLSFEECRMLVKKDHPEIPGMMELQRIIKIHRLASS